MSNSDFIPRSDGDFNLWQGSLLEYVALNLAAWGIPEPKFQALTALQTVCTDAFNKASNRQNRTAADVKAKDTARADYEKALRSFTAEWLSNNSKVADSDRTRMGLTVKAGTRTAVARPATSPVGSIDFSVRLQHTINFSDEATPRSKAKPEGVHGCEIYMKVDGDAPKDVSEMTYVATDTATPYVLNFDGSKGGKTVYYWLRWVNTRGEAGPWSVGVSALVMV